MLAKDVVVRRGVARVGQLVQVVVLEGLHGVANLDANGLLLLVGAGNLGAPGTLEGVDALVDKTPRGMQPAETSDSDKTAMRAAGTTSRREAFVILLGYAFVAFAIRTSNTTLYPSFDAVAPFARDINVGIGILISALVVAAALRKPCLLQAKALGPIAVVAALAGSALMTIGLARSSSVLLCTGAALRCVGTSWTSLLAGIACCSLTLRQLFVGIPAALLGGYALAWATTALSLEATLALLALSPLLVYIFCCKHANRLVDEIACSPAQDDARLMRPASYLPLTSRMFTCMLLATAVLGFNLRLGPVEGGSATPLASLATLVVLALIGWFGTHLRLYDVTFRTAIVLSLAAFLIMPLKSYMPLTQNLLAAAAACFDTVFALAMISAAARNRLSAVTVLAWGSMMTTLGSIIGANMGAFVGANTNNETVFLASAAVAAALIAYVLFGLADFSFAATIEGIEPVRPLQIPQAYNARLFEDSCARIAQANGLTPRETEVLALLARGRNNAFVQEELTLTRNTVKSYIKHIYAKLNVHSQQELIDLVENERF